MERIRLEGGPQDGLEMDWDGRYEIRFKLVGSEFPRIYKYRVCLSDPNEPIGIYIDQENESNS